MNNTLSDPEFLQWARLQIPKYIGPARFAVMVLLLKNVWDEDPTIRGDFQAALEFGRAHFVSTEEGRP